MPDVYEEIEDNDTPPEPSVLRRASSYSDFYRVVREQLSKDDRPRRRKVDRENRGWEALMLPESTTRAEILDPKSLESPDDQMLDASQQEYMYAPMPRGTMLAF